VEGRWLQVVVGTIAVLAIFAAIRVASSVFAPVACALFIIAILGPMQSRLQSRLPKLVALAIVILVTVVVSSRVGFPPVRRGRAVLPNQ
jgi:predicted PurR-regulated permease PerM